MTPTFEEYQREVYSKEINIKAEGKILSLLDVLYAYPDSWVQFYVLGNDSVTGRFLVKESKKFYYNDIVCGVYAKGKYQEETKTLKFSSKNKENRNDELVWYIAYGSDMFSRIFLCYIEGGVHRLY